MRKIIRYIFLLCFLFLIGIQIYKLFQTARNDRSRLEKDSRIATSQIHWSSIEIVNVRDYTRRTEEDYDVNYYEKTFDLNQVESVDFFLSTFALKEKIWHTFLSFWLTDWSQIAISIEARKEIWESYSPLQWLLNQYELYYLIADEEDIISIRTEVRDEPVYHYVLDITPPQAQQLLLSLLEKANTLAEKPEFYNTIFDNCTSVLRKHVNDVSPWTLWLNRWLLLTGKSDYYLYDQWLLKTSTTKEQLRTKHKINKKIWEIVGKDGFSKLLRK